MGKLMETSRREFIAGASSALIIGENTPSYLFAALQQTDATTDKSTMKDLDFDALPNFCSHEHWGSIFAIGMDLRADMEPGAVPNRPVSIWDIVLDPLLCGWIAATGIDLPRRDRGGGPDILAWFEDIRARWGEDPANAFDTVLPHLLRQALTGHFQCFLRGMLFLHNIDLGRFDRKDWQAADLVVRDCYADIFAWHRTAMKEANLSGVIRPVHPEFYSRRNLSETGKQELAFTNTILRIDPLFDLWKEESGRRENLADITRVDPVDARTWRLFIARIFELAAEGKTTGIKQLQAYTRSLEYETESDNEVRWRGDLERDQIRTFQNWVMHECCKQAHERGWPHQIHVGTHNLVQSSPLPLGALAGRYPNMKVVMIHCWPFINESGWLTKQVPNIYIDACWQPALNPQFLRQSLTTWVNFVPTHKIMLGHDTTSVEMAVGSSRFTREILSEILGQDHAKLDDSYKRKVAADMLQNNALHVYGVAGML